MFQLPSQPRSRRCYVGRAWVWGASRTHRAFHDVHVYVCEPQLRQQGRPGSGGRVVADGPGTLRPSGRGDVACRGGRRPAARCDEYEELSCRAQSAPRPARLQASIRSTTRVRPNSRCFRAMTARVRRRCSPAAAFWKRWRARIHKMPSSCARLPGQPGEALCADPGAVARPVARGRHPPREPDACHARCTVIYYYALFSLVAMMSAGLPL